MVTFNLIIQTTFNVIISLVIFVECDPNKNLALNITRLLDKLLTNYSKSLRPTHESG